MQTAAKYMREYTEEKNRKKTEKLKKRIVKWLCMMHSGMLARELRRFLFVSLT